MLKIGGSRLFEFAYNGAESYADYLANRDEPGPVLTAAEWAGLCGLDLRVAYCAEVGPGCPQPTAGEMVGLSRLILELVPAGYAVFSWSSLAGEVLVLGYRAGELEPFDDATPDDREDREPIQPGDAHLFRPPGAADW